MTVISSIKRSNLLNPTGYPCTDPRHHPAHLAAILSTRWRLPAELAEHLPEPPARDEETEQVIH